MNKIIEYISVIEASNKWGISPKRVQVLCASGRVDGAARIGRTWAIPHDAEKPVDMRFKKNRKECAKGSTLQQNLSSLTSQKALEKSTLFKGYTGKDLLYALEFFKAKEQHYRKEELILMHGEKWSNFALVISGAATASMDDINGNRIIMANVTPGITFGESLCFLDVSESPIYITASDDAHVLWLSLENIKRPGKYTNTVKAYELTLRFTAMLAKRTLDMNDRIQILSKRSLHEKLVTFFTQQVRLVGSNKFTVNMSRENMASYLGADRSALSRELSRMKKDGDIVYKKNSFEILASNLLE